MAEARLPTPLTSHIGFAELPVIGYLRQLGRHFHCGQGLNHQARAKQWKRELPLVIGMRTHPVSQSNKYVQLLYLLGPSRSSGMGQGSASFSSQRMSFAAIIHQELAVMI
jgi:hypothetical protein